MARYESEGIGDCELELQELEGILNVDLVGRNDTLLEEMDAHPEVSNALNQGFTSLRQQLDHACSKAQDGDVEIMDSLMDSHPVCHIWNATGTCRLGNSCENDQCTVKAKVATVTASHSCSV